MWKTFSTKTAYMLNNKAGIRYFQARMKKLKVKAVQLLVHNRIARTCLVPSNYAEPELKNPRLDSGKLGAQFLTSERWWHDENNWSKEGVEKSLGDGWFLFCSYSFYLHDMCIYIHCVFISHGMSLLGNRAWTLKSKQKKFQVMQCH